MEKATSVDEYIALFPAEVRQKLQTLRTAVKKAAPKAVEKIAYGMPAYALHGPLVYFAAYKHHIGVYPMPSAITAFAADLSAYKTSKGAIQFPLDKPLPMALIKQLVEFRIARNQAKATVKKTATPRAKGAKPKSKQA